MVHKEALCNHSICRGVCSSQSLSCGCWKRSSAFSLWWLVADGNEKHGLVPVLYSPRVDLLLNRVLSTAPAFYSQGWEVRGKQCGALGTAEMGERMLGGCFCLCHWTALVLSLHCRFPVRGLCKLPGVFQGELEPGRLRWEGWWWRSSHCFRDRRASTRVPLPIAKRVLAGNGMRWGWWTPGGGKDRAAGWAGGDGTPAWPWRWRCQQWQYQQWRCRRCRCRRYRYRRCRCRQWQYRPCLLGREALLAMQPLLALAAPWFPAEITWLLRFHGESRGGRCQEPARTPRLFPVHGSGTKGMHRARTALAPRLVPRLSWDM